MFSTGHACLCRRAAPALFRVSSPLCYRCTGMLIGVALGAAVGVFLGLNTWSWWLLGVSGCVLSLPALADVVAQMISAYRSTVLRRSTTGLLLGLGVVCMGTMVRIVTLGSPEGHTVPDLFSSTATARLEANQ